MSRWIRDVRHAARALRGQPLYSAASVLTLGLGIGATTAAFTVVHGVLLAPLPVEDPERLVRVYLEEPERPGGREYVTAMDALLVRAQADVLAHVAVFYDYQEQGADLSAGGATDRVRVLPVSSGYFELMGTAPFLGRELSEEEERADARVAVVRHRLWKERFGDPAAVGATLRLDDVPYTVVGVLPPDFRDPLAGDVDVYVPQDLDPTSDANNWDNHYLSAVARLATGIGIEEAGERLRAVALPANEANRGDADDFWLPRLVPLHEDLVGRAETLLWVLLGAVGLVLLLACANVANLSLARGTARGRELAVRSALGAGRGGLVRQLLAESLLIAGAGGALGVAVASSGVAAFRTLAAGQLPRTEEVGLDASVLLFGVGVTLLTALAFGLLPALRHSRPDLAAGLGTAARASAAGTYRTRRALVAVQVAVALVLAVGAGLLARSFLSIQAVELGLDPEGVLTYDVHLPEARYPGAAERTTFYDELFARVGALPGVRAAGAIHWLPVQGRGYRWGLWRVDAPPGTEAIGADVRIVEGDYFGALGVPLLRGRAFDRTDRQDGSLAALLNRSASERLFPDEDPVGSQVRVGGRTWTVVGVAEDVANDPLGDVSAMVYLPHAQFADRQWSLHQVISASGDPASLVGPLRQVLRSIDPELVLHRPRPMTEVLARGLARQRLAATVMAAFAALALLLAVVGIYGVLAYLVGRRTHEIGIRMALGARARDVRALVVRESLLVSVLGLAAGIVAARVLSRWLGSLLFEVEATDPATYATVVAGLLAVALLAAWMPARRAARIDPALAFRSE